MAVSVAAASIVAKVTRDRIMVRMHRRYPAFGFDRNVGYGTPEHLEVLDRLGPTDPRLSFACVGSRCPGMDRSIGLPTWEPPRIEHDPMNEDDIERFEEERGSNSTVSTKDIPRCSHS